MSIANFKNNPANNSTYTDAEKNGDSTSINPMQDGESRTAEVLNRPSNFDWGRTEILKESVEALWSELLIRKFSVEAIARLWTGYYYNNNGTSTFVPGKILIPANTSLKIVGYALPQWGVIPGSGNVEYYQNPVIGICFNKSNNSFVTLRFRRASNDNLLEEYNPTSGGIKCGHEIILKLTLGPSNQVQNAILKSSTINDKYAVFEVSLKDGANISPDDIADAFSNNPYVVIAKNGTSTISASLLAGHAIKSGETINSYDDISTSDTSLQFYNRAPISKYEIDIPADILKSFFDQSSNAMYPGDILFVRFPQRAEIPRDGSMLREVQNRQYIGKHLVTDINDLIVYTKRNNYNVQKLSPTNHLLIPIVRINAPHEDNYNQIDPSKEILVNKLFYAEFIDGVKVYPGKWHYDINEEDEGTSSLDARPSPLTTARKEDLALSGIGDGSICGNSYIQLSNGNYYYENKDYLLIRGVDPANNKVTIIKINNNLAVDDGGANIYYAQTLEISGGLVIAIHNQKVTYPKTIDVGANEIIPHWNDGYTLTDTMERFEEHRQVGTEYGHGPKTVAGNAIKDHEITGNKISSNEDVWAFNGVVSAVSGVSQTSPNILLGNTYWNSNIGSYLQNFAISLNGPALLGIGSLDDSINKVGGLSIKLPFASSSIDPGYIVRVNDAKTALDKCLDADANKMVGILLKNSTSTKSHVLVYGICYVRVAGSLVIDPGNLIVLNDTAGNEGTVTGAGSSPTYTIGIALASASGTAPDRFVYMLYWGYRKM